MKIRKNASFSMLWLFVAASISQHIVWADELRELQGKWEFRFQENGRNLRALKIIDDDMETVETYDGNQLVHRHVVKLEAIEAEGICVIKYGESTVTDGARKGQKGKPGSFVSKRLKNKWYNVSGLNMNEETPLSVAEFTRIPEEKKP
jgi:hypothetical protein